MEDEEIKKAIGFKAKESDDEDDNEDEEKEEDEEKKVLKLFEKNLKEAEAYRKTKEDKWIEYENFFNGNHFKHTTSRYKTNFIYAAVKSATAQILDGQPGTTIIPVDQDQKSVEAAKKLSAGVEYVCEDQNLKLKLEEAVINAFKGPSFMMVSHDEDGDNGDGKELIEVLPWRQVYLDPSGKDHYLILRLPKRLEDIKRMFPEKKNKIKKSGTIDELGYFTQSSGVDPEKKRYTDNASSGMFEIDDLTLLDIRWAKDYSMEETPEEELNEEILKENQMLVAGVQPVVNKFENHIGHIPGHKDLKRRIGLEMLGVDLDTLPPEQAEELVRSNQTLSVVFSVIDDHIEMHEMFKDKNPKGLRPKYYNFNRYTVKVGKEILYDGEFVVKKCPIPVVKLYIDKDQCPYGDTPIKHIIDLQKAHNDIEDSEYCALMLCGNSGWIIDENSGVDSGSLTNEQGIVVIKNQGTEVQRLPPGQISPNFMQKKQDLRQCIEILLGVNEVTRGVNPTGVTSGDQFRELRTSALTRIRLIVNRLNSTTLLPLGEILAKFIQFYWSGEKKIRLIDSTGEVTSVDLNSDEIADLEYEVKVAPDTTAGQDKATIYNMYKEMLIGGVISKNIFFNIVDVPYKKKIMEMLQQEDEVNNALIQLQQENEQLKMQLASIAAPPQPMPNEQMMIQ